jgi:nitroreductase
MDVMEAILARESVREYLDRPVEDEKLERVLDAGRLAPSAINAQEWRYVVVRDADLRQRLMKAARGQKFVGQAPVVIACCAETDGRVMLCGQTAYPINLAISIDHMTLAAVAEGLGTCWVGSFHADEVKEILGIPGGIRVVQLLTLGYPARRRGQKIRKALSEIVRYERW